MESPTQLTFAKIVKKDMIKKCFSLLLFCLSFLSYSQVRDSVEWNTPYFRIWYSEPLENPLSIRYGVACPNGTASRAGMDFYTLQGIHTSDDADYIANEWDKGHMAPAASFNCNKDMLYETFTYINSSLQHQSLNRGVWKKLENRERYLAGFVEVQVFIRVEFDKVPPRVPTNAAIPKGYYKELKVGKVRECYYFPNKAPKTKELDDYKCPCRNAIN